MKNIYCDILFKIPNIRLFISKFYFNKPRVVSKVYKNFIENFK